MSDPTFEKSVFINCPFDRQYEPILQAILFCAVYLGFSPRLSKERYDFRESRLEKIMELIEGCKFLTHDLSRCQAASAGEHYRMNMPFELGIDHGCRSYFGNGRELKKILILEEEPCRYQAAISDLAGWDIMNHGGDYQVAVRQVRKWFVTETHVDAVGPSRILGAYADFQGWHYQQQLAKGWSEEDIQDYPTNELLGGMNEWTEKRRPL